MPSRKPTQRTNAKTTESKETKSKDSKPEQKETKETKSQETKETKEKTDTPVQEKPTRKRQTKKESAPPVPPTPSAEPETDADTEAPVPKVRQVPTRESVEEEFNAIMASVEAEITRLRSSSAKSKGVKFLRTVNKRVRILKNHALRISKTKTTNRRNNGNSGFLKPVQISKDLATFTGWDRDQPRSRVEVTKFICNYIKEHDLQNPSDRRQIVVDNDSKLKTLLKFVPTKPDEQLTYYNLQKCLKTHFLPANSTPAPLASVKEEVKSEKVEKKESVKKSKAN